MRYLNDWIWLRLSNRYNVASATHSLGDVYNRWVNEVTGSLGVDLVDFYLDRIPDAESLNDAEYAYWAGGPLQDAVLWLDAGSTHPALVKVPNLGSGGSVLDAQYGDGSTVTTYPTLLEHTGENYVYLPGVAGNYASTPDAAVLDIAGDIDIRVRVALDDWTPGADTVLVGKLVSAGDQRSYSLRLTTGGSFYFTTSPDGINGVNTLANAANTLTNGQTYWIRATLDVDDGAGNRVGNFYWAPDSLSVPTVWTPIGTTVTAAGTTSIHIGTAPLEIGSFNGGTSQASGKFYRTQVLDGINGTVVFDADFTKLTYGGQTTFTEDSVNAATVTINRSATGRKSVVVDRNVWLFGSNDYLEVADNALLDFGASDSFTVMTVVRQWATVPAATAFLAKKPSLAATTGWSLYGTNAPVLGFTISDGAVSSSATAAPTLGSVTVLSGVRNVDSDQIVTYLGTTATAPIGDTTTTTLANADVLRVGRLSAAGTSYADMELFAVAVWRRALTADEVALVTQYYNLSVGPWGGLVLGEDDLPILTESGDVINVE